MGLGHFGPVYGQFSTGTGVEYAPNSLNGDGDILGRGPLLRAFKQHVFDEVRSSSLFVCLVTRPDAQEKADAH